MLFNKSELRIFQTYQLNFSENALLKLEDAAKDNKELLITIDASHFGMLNGHGVIYRHDTVRNNLHTFIYPNSKPMIERHNMKTSAKFGSIIAADYKLTKFYDQLAKEWELENLTTEEYLDLCKDVLIPTQKKISDFNGLAYVQVMGKLKHQDAIDKVLKKKFVNVSIGADPKRLICSVCGQDQCIKICDHYADKSNKTFMLAEELEYEELSFVPRGADPYGKVVKIHDEDIKLLDSVMDVMDIEDFKQLTENKTVVCVNNICKICDQEEEMAKRKDVQTVSVSYKEEFSVEQLKELKINDELLTDEVIETLELKDEALDTDFAIVQKTDEGMKRRLFIGDELSTKIAIQMIDSAEDMTEQEVAKAKKSIVKAAKKFGIECACKDSAPEIVIPEVTEQEVKVEDVKTVESLMDELVTLLKEVDETKLEDSAEAKENKPKPISFIMSALTSLGNSLKWAGEDLKMSLDYYLKSLGQEVIDKSVKDSMDSQLTALQDELEEVKSDVALLDEQNRELNYQIKVSLADEIVFNKGIAEDKVEEEKAKYMKFTYESLKDLAGEYRNSSTNSSKAVNNKQSKNFKTVKDPTLADEQGQELEDGKIKDEAPVEKLTDKQLAEAIKYFFTK